MVRACLKDLVNEAYTLIHKGVDCLSQSCNDKEIIESIREVRSEGLKEVKFLTVCLNISPF